MNVNIFDLTYPELQNLVSSWNEPNYRATQIWQGLYRNLWSSSQEFTPLSAALREKMQTSLWFSSLTPLQTLTSSDQETEKILFQLPDEHSIETVLMKYNERRTLCVSTQAGCAMGCVFCATGQMGFKRNLTSGEIVEQVLFFSRKLKQQNDHLTNIVIMGMGEPFLNYENTIAAIDRLNDPQGFGFGERRFTISTVGIVPVIEQFTSDKRQINLAISLHAANDEHRSRLLPINKKYPLSVLIPACREYVKNTGRRITFEWALIEGINDTPEHAEQLAKLIKGILCHVNVISLNPTNKYNGQPSSQQRVKIFQSTLEKTGIPCTIRLRRGVDIHAGCGQLASRV